ncbi:OPT oligopeptide transporter protein-domain-containing protein [Dactylonectria macrodidyma]|uniref:OPT oligopeptide transporter protein-domain-containing protein n=1 Tax=Dactylonectria macrodidyma TaxID=307937 RepID=A0A9P9EP14_9HYPO|nr:OPT oligopeptide transporter protein-domain-containing protein [Dactylonectria macrodidyma]
MPDPVTLAPEKTQTVHDIDQKHGDLARVTTSGDKSIQVGEVEAEDTFQPLLDVEPYDGRQILTVRAVGTGVFLGSIISCANLYLGLKTGFGADATLFSSIFGYGILKALERSKLPLMSDYFGPHENNIVQATALGCMGVAFIFVSGVPALMQMGLLGDSNKVSYGTLVSMSVMCGFWGLGFAVPLRSIFILKLARQLGLQFPLGTASAVTIRALHNKTGADTAKKNIMTMSIVFAASLIWAVVTSYAPGILYTWNVFWWIYKWGGHGIISAVSWGWLSWQWSPSLIGTGMIVGLNPSLSFLFGSVLAWGIIGPILVKTGQASGIPISEIYPGLVTYNAFDPTKFVHDPSPRYWILWPAVFLMLSVSITTILFEAKSLGRVFRYGALRLRDVVKRGAGGQATTGQRAMLQDNIPDPVAADYQVRWWEWSSMAAVAFAVAMVLMRFLFDITGGMGFFHLVLGLLWSFVVIQVFGVTGITPIATVAKGSQFITGGILRSHIDTIGYSNAAVSNLLGATVTSGAAQQAAELVQDFRTGFLLRTPMRPQWYAQAIGTISAIFFLPGLYMLFIKAWPCITDSTATTCAFALPAVTAWKIITIGLFSPTMPISQSSWITCIVFSVIGMASVVLKRRMAAHARWSRWEPFTPNMSVVGLSMTIPGATIPMTLAIGAVVAALWERYGQQSHSKLFYAVSAGGIAGEGVAYVVLGILQIAQVGGPTHFGTHLGCVAESC